MPCLNEEKTIELCICKALAFLKKYHIDGEILIVDNAITANITITAKSSINVNPLLLFISILLLFFFILTYQEYAVNYL